MYVRMVFKKHSVLIETDRIVEKEIEGKTVLHFWKGDSIFVELTPGKEEDLLGVYVMNNDGKTITNYISK